MPTPYGSRGGMAFSADELRVLRRALAVALRPSSQDRTAIESGADQAEADAALVRDCLRLADSVDEAVREAARSRAFLIEDLGRYRAALPGTAASYLELLPEALAAGHRPEPDDLAALRALRGNPAAAALLDRCQTLAEKSVRTRRAGRREPPPRARLLALPGGRAEEPKPGEKPEPKPESEPRRPAPSGPAPSRPVPTPAEVFPPKRRRPAAPESPDKPADPPQQLAAG
ncbi:hypothetical protein [Streptomyces sp. NPDC002851]